jgi:hypothetical protein
MITGKDLIEHSVATLVGPRMFGIAVGYEDINDHDDLRRDPVMKAEDVEDAGKEDVQAVARHTAQSQQPRPKES